MSDFWAYFNIADELDGGLTLNDLEKREVEKAALACFDLDLPWPPDLATAEEFLNDHPELRGSNG